MKIDAIDKTCVTLEIDEEGCRLMREAAIEVYGPKEQKPRKKRAPSGYNIFIGECMSKNKIKSFAAAGEKMKKCAIEWKKGGPELKKEYETKKERMRG